MLIPVRPALFVPVSDHMAELVQDDSKLVTAASNREALTTKAFVTHKGGASENQQMTQ
jgi:hypothetical protein